MHAMIVREAAGSKLVWEEVENPVIGEEDVLIRVRATAVNRADLLQRKGLYPPPSGESDILGLECAGDVASVGGRVDDVEIGDRVCALLAGGGYAEYVRVNRGVIMPMPKGSYEDAASIPEAFLTAYLNVIKFGELEAGQIVVVHAGASGVGTAAIQVAALYGARVIATASASKHELCLALGAHDVVDYRRDDYVETLNRTTGSGGADVILDPVGAANLEMNVGLLKPGGRLVLIGLLGGSRSAIPLDQVLKKNIRIIGSTLRSKPILEKSRLVAGFKADLLPHFDDGRLKPVVDSIFPMDRVEEAHQRMIANQNVGKIVLRLDR